MVKTGHSASLPLVRFDASRALGVEVLTLSSLARRLGLRRPGRPHRTDFHHLLVVTHGRGTHVVDFERHVLEPGMVVYVGPGQVHAFGHEPRLDATMVVFRPEAVRTAVLLQSVRRPSPERLALATALLDGLAHECATSRGSPASGALLGALLEALVRTVDGDGEHPERAGLFGRFTAALEREFRRTHEVAAYAAILRCSSRTLTRHSLETTGQSAKRVIEARVLLEARRCLAHESTPVATLAGQLGFAEPTQFVKFFRRVSGETPGRFRARLARDAR